MGISPVIPCVLGGWVGVHSAGILVEEDCTGVGEGPTSQDSRAEILKCALYCARDEGNSLRFRLIQQLQTFNVGILRECERPQKGVTARPSFGRILGCQSSEGVTRVRPFVECSDGGRQSGSGQADHGGCTGTQDDHGDWSSDGHGSQVDHGS